MDDLLYACRAANVVLAVTAAVSFALRVNLTWEIVDRPGRLLRLGLVALLFTVAIRTVESHVQGNVPGYGTALYTLSLLGVLHGLWALRRRPAPRR